MRTPGSEIETNGLAETNTHIAEWKYLFMLHSMKAAESTLITMDSANSPTPRGLAGILLNTGSHHVGLGQSLSEPSTLQPGLALQVMKFLTVTTLA